MTDSTAFPNIFRPIAVGPLKLGNRIIMGSMHTGLEYGGEPEFQRLADFYRARAEQGVKLIITGGFSPNLEGNLGEHRGEIASPAAVPLHRMITEAVHGADGKVLVQLLHAGRYGKHEHAIAPSPIRAPINRVVPREMDEDDITRTIADFATAAGLAKQAGYDGCEIMGSEGYLITEFLCPRTNHRTDQWGGSLQNRMRFAVQVVEAVRAEVGPDFMIAFRTSVLDLVEGGQTGAEIRAVARAVEAAGADMLTTGIGWHEARVPTIAQAVPTSAFLFAVKAMRDAVSIPVAASNRMNTPELAEEALTDGDIDMVMLARPFLADAGFVAKARDNDTAALNPCIACNQACLDLIFRGEPTTCLVNPAAAREAEFILAPTEAPKSIAVVGGGVAGMAAAARAAERGHAVTLYEAGAELGGQFRLAQEIPGKEIFGATISYSAERMRRAGVTIKLDTTADAEELASGHDEVVLAAGVLPRALDIEGADHPSVVGYTDLLSGKVTAGRRVVVIGAGGIGFDVALYLLERSTGAHLSSEAFAAHWGIDRTISQPGGLNGAPAEHAPAHEVTMLKRSEGRFGRTLGLTTGWVHQINLKRAGVTMIDAVRYRRIDDAGVHISREGEDQVIPADTVVVCAGQETRDELKGQLAALGRPVHPIGGARLAAELDAMRAIEEGTRLADRL